MITVDVPGKLYIAGEYSVLAPGATAVLVAVNRYLTVRLAPVAVPGERTLTSAQLGVDQLALVRRHGRTVAVQTDSSTNLGPVLTAVDLVDRYAAELGQEPIGFALEIRSELDDDATGRKYGLGSSGAVTVGVIRALTQAYRLDPSDDTLLRLALLSTFSVDPNCSGGDVAASLLGGWVAYRAPDRAWLADQLARPRVTLAALLDLPWPLLSARRLPGPRALSLAVGWSGRPAGSSGLVVALRGRVDGESAAFARFVLAGNACAHAVVRALEAGDDAALAAAVATAGALLRAMSELAGVVIETPELAALRQVAESLGAVAKSSGAGGGDCGIALVAPSTAHRLRARWRAVGITPLDIHVHQPLRGKDRSGDIDRLADLRQS
ncbi:phosphomevalonate kinase [Nocardia sp. AG03]|uniref:phosphomevalonate kinase n=1 Tax=Nocardia sp. AG03 TaxID=3025312 RepID=UPI002418578B|nr:phosphomevalonate kinase [Nocardia sp. AG03]